MKIAITGSTGFVGANLINNFKHEFEIIKINKGENEIGFADVLIHLVGIAHDLKNVALPEVYYKVNTEITKDAFDTFLNSRAKIFITLSSVKAAGDFVEKELVEDATTNPGTHYGKSKLLAEQYIRSQPIPEGKKVYILRPCMIHGPGNKGNLNLLYSLVSKGLPWPLGLYDNSRSYLSIENLCFVIRELIVRDDIPSGVYNVADDEPLSTNEVINLISESKGKKSYILNINKTFIKLLALLGDLFKLPLNTERLQKLTESYVVSNVKIKKALDKPLPVSTKEGLIRTFKSFSTDV